MKPVKYIFAAMGFGLLAAASVEAREVCMPMDEMGAALIDWYGERPVSVSDDNRVQLWRSEETGTWTEVRTFSDGRACVVDQGQDGTLNASRTRVIAALQR